MPSEISRVSEPRSSRPDRSVSDSTGHNGDMIYRENEIRNGGEDPSIPSDYPTITGKGRRLDRYA